MILVWGLLVLAILIGIASFVVPEMIADWLEARQREKADISAYRYVETPHEEKRCHECGHVSCLTCPGQGFRHATTCTRYHHAL